MARQKTITQYVYSSATYSVTVVHDKNGGDTGPSNVTSSQSTSASSVTVYADISNTVPTRTGYRFLGYATARDGTASKQPGGSVSRSFSRQATFDHKETVQAVDGNTYETYYYNTANQSATIYLYAQWEAAASTVSASDGTLGTAQTITISAVSADYTHNLRYAFGGSTGTIASGVSSSYIWTPALSLAELIPAANSASCTIYCDTVSNGTVVGTTQTVITLSVPAAVKCTVASVAIVETVAGIDSKFHAFVQNKSKVSVTGTFNSGNGYPAYGATVSAVSITINGQTMSGNGSVTNILTTSGTNSYTLTITDTRGRTDTYTSTFNVLAYTAPSVTETANRNSADETQIDVAYNWTISACSNLNDKAIAITYGPVGGTQTTVSVTPATYTGSGSYAITGTDTNDTYSVTVTLTDYFTSANASSSVSATGDRVMHISATDKTVSWHNTNHSDGYDHQWFNQRFHGAVDVVQRRCPNKSLSSAGWYRVMNLNTSASGRAGTSWMIDMEIGTAYINNPNEVHSVRLFGMYDSYAFANESSMSLSTVGITKVRYTQDAEYNGHIDIYYARTSANYVNVNFKVWCTADHISNFVSNQFTAVVDAPVGETVKATYTFFANSDADHDITALGKSWHFRKRNGIVYVDAYDKMTPVASGANSVGTLPAGFKPKYSVALRAANISTGYKTLFITTAGVVTAYCYTTVNEQTDYAISGSYIANS